MANLPRDLMGFALTFISRYKKEKRVENSFSTLPAPSRFSPRNKNRPASKSNTFLVHFSANYHVKFPNFISEGERKQTTTKCSFSF